MSAMNKKPKSRHFISGRKIENSSVLRPLFQRPLSRNVVTLNVNSLGLKVRTRFVCEVFVPRFVSHLLHTKNCMNVTYKGKFHLDISIKSYLFYGMTSIRLSRLFHEFIRQIERSQLNLPRVHLQEIWVLS